MTFAEFSDLGLLDSSLTHSLVAELVPMALSHRNALAVRQLLGRMPYADASSAVPPAVWDQLALTGDDDAYRRMADLLRHLGLRSALGELCRRAAASDDEDVREVASDFGDPPDR